MTAFWLSWSPLRAWHNRIRVGAHQCWLPICRFRWKKDGIQNIFREIRFSLIVEPIWEFEMRSLIYPHPNGKENGVWVRMEKREWGGVFSFPLSDMRRTLSNQHALANNFQFRWTFHGWRLNSERMNGAALGAKTLSIRLKISRTATSDEEDPRGRRATSRDIRTCALSFHQHHTVNIEH